MKDPQIESAIGVCKRLSVPFPSVGKKREMAVAQAELSLPTESPTRWGSRQKMIERVLEQEKAIALVLGSEKKKLCAHMARHRCIRVSEQNHETAVKPVLHVFRSSLRQPEEEDTELTKKKREYLDDKDSEPATDELMDMTSLMDPRFQTTYIDHDKVEQINKELLQS